MDEILKELKIKNAYDPQITAALMIQSNALIPIKLAVHLCGISRQEIDRRVQFGTFPKPQKLSDQKEAMRKAFYISDVMDWIKKPQTYKQSSCIDISENSNNENNLK